LEKVLEGLQLTFDQFVDVAILLGCDFCPRIKGIGPKRAFDFIKKYKTIENVLKHLDKEKFPLPEPYNFEAARKLFKFPDVYPASSLQTEIVDMDEEGLIKYMVDEKGFKLDRIKNNIEKYKKSKKSTVQTRITDFFKITDSPKKDSPKKEVKKETKKRVYTPKKKSSVLKPKNTEEKPKTPNKKKRKREDEEDESDEDYNPTKKQKVRNISDQENDDLNFDEIIPTNQETDKSQNIVSDNEESIVT